MLSHKIILPKRRHCGYFANLFLFFIFCNTNHFLIGASYEQDLTSKAGDLVDRKKFGEALTLYNEALGIYISKYGNEHEYIALIYTSIANAYLASGDKKSAQKYLEKALSINLKKFGPTSPETAEAMFDLGLVLTVTGDLKRSRELLEASLKVRQAKLGLDNTETIQTAQLLNVVDAQLGSLSKKEITVNKKNQDEDINAITKSMSALLKALDNKKKKGDLNDSETGILYYSIASFYLNSYKSYEYSLKALDIFERNGDLENKNLALEQHIWILMFIGEEQQAIKTCENLIIFYRTNSKYSSGASYGAFLLQAGQLYSQIGQYEKGLELANEGLNKIEAFIGDDSPSIIPFIQVTATIRLAYLINQNQLSKPQKDRFYEENISPLLLRQYKLSKSHLGDENPQTAQSILFYAGALKKTTGDWNQSLSLIDEAIGIYEKLKLINSLGYLNAVNTKARMLLESGKNSEAKQYAKNNLYLYDGQSSDFIQVASGGLSSTLELLYLLDIQDNVYKYVSQILAEYRRQLSTILILDENTKLSWQQQKIREACFYIMTPPQISKFLFDWKGIILDSVVEDRNILALARKNNDKQAEELEQLQAEFSKLSFENGNKDEISLLQKNIATTHRALSNKYSRNQKYSNFNTEMSDIMPALSGGGVLVDFIEFQDPKLKGEESTCFGAIITGEDNSPFFVRIDGGKSINRSIENLRSAINQGDAAEVEAQTKFLSQKLWQPVAAKIPEGAKRLFICPDANLNFLSFAALLESDGRFVAEKYPISYIGSARDLAKKPSEKITKSMAIFANPQFDAGGKSSKTTEMVAMRSAEADVFGSIALPPLPGTETEAQSLGSLATESGWNVKSALGKDATESSVRSAKKPGVLHLATHGFYLNSFTPPAPEGSRGMSVVGINETTEEKKKNEKGVDPMRASGVALTGAQNTLSFWSQRKAPDPESDGVLTAEEVGALRLDGTWMVVLSACETGVGEARSGEGVFGLRRAFMIAGAENLLMTLWPVADETTAQIMTDFYKEAFATGDAAGSLAKVQRDWLVKLRQERGLLAAIREAGPFAMVTMTAPSGTREFVEGVIQENETTSGQPPATKDSSDVVEDSENPLDEILEMAKDGDSNAIKAAIEGAEAYNKHLDKTIEILERALKRAKIQNDNETFNLVHGEALKELKDLNRRIKKGEAALTQIDWPSPALKSKYMSETEKSKSALSKLAEIISESTVVL
jgi:CHAT domain-containing protein